MERIRESAVVWITLIAYFILPFIISTPVATEIAIWGLFAMGFNILLGHTGIISFGHAAYFGLGCYFCGIALRYFGLSVWVAILVSLISGALSAGFVGLLAIRKKGVYFAMNFTGRGPDVLFPGPFALEKMDRG